MKRILILFLLTLYTTLAFAGGKFYTVNSVNTSLDIVKPDNKIQTTQLITKQTYDCQNTAYTISTSTNSDCIVAFSANVLIKLGDNTKLNVDVFDQSCLNINELPEIAKFNTTNLTLSVNGSIQVVVPHTFTEENPFVISTELANIVIKNGKFIVRSDEKSLLILVLEGEATVMDTLSRHKQIIKQKDVLMVVPAPKLQGKMGEHFKKRNMFSIKSLDDNDDNAINSDLNMLTDIQSNIKFIVVDKNVVGVKIR